MRRNLQVLAKAILFLLWLGGAYFIWLSRNTVTSDERLEQKNSVSAERSDNEQSVTSVGSVDLVAVGETGPRPSGANGNFSKQAGSASVDNRNKSLGRRKSVTDVSSEFLPENQEMIALLVENVRWAKKVREECGRFSAAVESGKLDVDNNNGMWQASSATSHVVMSATFYSKDGLMSTFTKRVYEDIGHVRAKLSDCYVARFDIEGRLKSLKRHEPDVGLQYFANGRLRKFGAKTKEGYQYLSYWDENGIFVREGVSRGIIGEIKDGKYIKYPNHPDFEKPIP